MNKTNTVLITIAVVIALVIGFYVLNRKTCFIPCLPCAHTSEKTLAIIKPDAVAAKNAGKIIDIIENNNFEIIRMQKVHLTNDQARKFYAAHKDKKFFNELINFMTSGPIIVMALGKENAIKEWRNLMGNTNPETSSEGSIRKQFGTNIQLNAVHGSDAPETAKQELLFFFPDL